MLEIKFKQLLKTLSINHKIILTFRFFIGNLLFYAFPKENRLFLQIITLKTDHQELLRSAHFRCICFFSRHKLLRMLGVETCGF